MAILKANPLQVYFDTVKQMEGDTKTIKQLHRQIADGGTADYHDLLRGGVSSKTLRRMGHPFGRRLQASKPGAGRVRGTLPLLPINRQTGRLIASIQLRPADGGTQAFHVGPTASAGRSMFVLSPGGTSKMVARGVYVVIEKRWKARNKALVDTMRRRG